MPTYAYEVYNTAGKRSKGVSTATSATALSQTLEERGMLVIEVVETKAEAGGGGGFKLGSGRREVLEFTRAMGSLLPVGMPLAQSLSAAAGVSTGEVKAAVLDIRERVQRGESLADSLKEHPRFFPPLYIGLVRAGERSGDLDSAFVRLTEQLEREDQLRGKVVNALVYPMILAVAGTGAIVVLLYFVIPKFVSLLKGDLPASTAAVMAISNFMREYWFIIALIPVAFFGFLTWTRSNDDGRRVMSRILLAIPGVKTLRQYSMAARFSRLMEVLLGGGAPLLVALDDTIESLTDPIARDDAIRVRGRIREGSSFRGAIAEGGLFPQLLSQLVGVGEDAGELRIFLAKAAEIFEERTERAAQRVATLAEPVLIMIFGGIVAFVALSLLQAMYSINAKTIG